MKKADHHLVQQVLDGDVTRETFDGFQRRLRDEPELAKFYREYAMLHHTLYEEFEDGHFSEPVPSAASSRMLGFPVLLAIAVALALAAAIFWIQPWSRGEAERNVALVTFSVDAVWSIEGTSRNLGGATGVARGCELRLSQGRASISLEPSVVTVLEGPAQVKFLSENSLHLERGRGFFRRGGTGGGLTVTTPRLTAKDSGTAFGIEVVADGPDELHVLEGKVQIVSKGEEESMQLVAGDAARVPVIGAIERFPSDGRRFATGLGKFRTVVSGPFDRAHWRVDYGRPSISEQRIEGANYSVFLRLPEPEPAGSDRVLLATLDVGKPVGGDFHADGWAGMSFFSKGGEVLFFGDSFGTKATWSLDVKQRIPVILPEHPVIGPRIVTLRYDPYSGDVSLHEGGVPLKAPFCSGKIPAGIRFDEIRLGASAGAALTVNALEIRVGGD